MTKIDAFVTTHYHEDHFGGIDDLVLLAKVQVLETYDRGDKAFLPASKSPSTLRFGGIGFLTGRDRTSTAWEMRFRLQVRDLL